MLNPLNDWNIVYNQLRETTNAQEATFQQVASRYRNDITMSNSTSKVSYFKLVPLNKVKVIQGYARDKEELLSIIKKMKNGSWEMYSFKDIDKYQLIGVLGYANEKLIFNYTNIFNLKSNVKTKYNAYSLHIYIYVLD